MVGPQAGRSFSGPVLDEFDIDGSGAVALPKEILDSLDALVTDWYLSATVVLKTRRIVKVELVRRDSITCLDLIMRDSMTIAPHFPWRLQERGALPLVRESPVVETGNKLQQGARDLVDPKSLATEFLSDVIVERGVQN